MKKIFSHKIISFLKKAKDNINKVVPKKQGAIFMVLALVLTGSLVLLQPAQALSEAGIATSIVNTLIGSMSQLLLWLAQLFIKFTVFFLDFFIRLASYNGFIDAPVVIIGWTMVRDVANMFFVVVLLVIAFGTILGIEQYEWKKTLAKFIMAAILINFSRLIAGLIIDAAHVFTMTFVNAISATAGGNIINMLHLEKILAMSGTVGEGALGGISDSADIRFDILIAAGLGAFFGFVSLMTIGAYMMIMVIRVIVLWILIILSPLPYILGVLQKTKGYADEYWQEFTNYVLVAPLAVFFLWLAFATLGSGDFAGPDLGLQFDTNKESQTAAAIGLKESGKIGATGVSLSEITSWENMANFILAVVFLWVGLERVQKSGVRGAEFAGKVQEYAKKGAYHATAKTAWHAPFGGKFWTRQGKTAVSRVKLGFQEAKIRQAEGAAARDKKGLIGASRFADTAIGKQLAGTALDKGIGKYLVNRGLGEVTGGMIGDSRARADKRAEDWEETVERQKKILDESYGTGSASEGGLRKTAMTARLQKKEAFIEQKKAQKVLDQRKKYEELIDSAQTQVQVKVDAGEIDKKDFEKEVEKALGGMTIPFGVGEIAMEQKAAKSNLLGYYKDSKLEAATLAKKEVLEDDIKSRDTLRAAKARDKHEAKLEKEGVFDRDVMEVHKREAKTEELTREQNRATEIRQAQKRDEVLKAKNKLPRYEEATLAKHQKEDIELVGNINYDRSMAMQEDLRSRILSETNPEKKANLLNEFQNMQAFNHSRGAVFGGSGTANTYDDLVKAGKISTPIDIDAGNVQQQQAVELSALLMEEVKADPVSINAAMAKLQTQKGDKFVPFMRTFTDGLMKAGMEGAVNKAGLFKEEYNPKTKQMEFRAVNEHVVDPSDPKDIERAENDKKWTNGKRGYAVAQSKATKIEGFRGAVDSSADGPTVRSNEARERVAEMFGGITANVTASVDKSNIDDFNKIFENMAKEPNGTAKIQELINKMLEKATDDNGIKALMARTNLSEKHPSIIISKKASVSAATPPTTPPPTGPAPIISP